MNLLSFAVEVPYLTLYQYYRSHLWLKPPKVSKFLSHSGGDHLCVLLIVGVCARLQEVLLEVHLGYTRQIREHTRIYTTATAPLVLASSTALS